MKKSLFLAGALALGAFAMAPEAVYSDVLAQWGPSGWGPAPAPKAVPTPGASYTVSVKNNEGNTEDHSASVLTALEGIKNVYSVDYDKEKKTFTVVMSDKNTLTKTKLTKALKEAKLEVSVDKFEKVEAKKEDSSKKSSSGTKK